MNSLVGKPGIGQQIATLVAVAVITAVLAVAGILSVFQLVESVHLKRSSVEGTAFVFASAVADHIEQGDVQATQAALRAVARVPGVISGSVYNSDGRLLTTLGQKAILESDVVSAEASFWAMLTHGTMPVAVNVIKGGSVRGTLVLVTDISDLRSTFFRTMTAVVLASLAAAVIGVFSSVPLQRRITGPIQTLTIFMRQVGETKDYRAKLDVTGSQEIGHLVDGFNSLISDIDVRDQSLRKLAYHDVLTGLPNLASLHDELTERIRMMNAGRIQGLAAIQFSVDGFRTLSHAFGQKTADASLVRIAGIIRSEIAPHDFLARIGNNGFGVLINDSGSAEATMARIHAVLFQSVAVDGSELHLSLAAGTAMLPQDTTDANEALRFMGLAVNEAMAQGTGRTCYFTRPLIDNARLEAELAQALHQAVANDELALRYQPQIAAATGEITGYEALVRWHHPVHGDISPSVFIPIAERHGAIAAIGEWVMLQSCRQGRNWNGEGRAPRSIAVNVSAAQMLQSGFVRKVSDIVQASGLAPELLCLEITESMFLGRAMAPVRAILAELHGIGVTLALDDFGTGYSSLAYLSELPFDKLKIDRSFVSSIQESPRRTALLRSIIAMAHALGLEVIAEGAETYAEFNLLRQLEADHVQGYIVSRPLPAEEIPAAGLTIASARALRA